MKARKFSTSLSSSSKKHKRTNKNSWDRKLLKENLCFKESLKSPFSVKILNEKIKR